MNQSFIQQRRLPHAILFGEMRGKPLPLVAFWVVVGLILFIVPFITQTTAFETLFAAGLIAIAALFPSYLWCSGRALGLPIYPIFTLTYLWTYAYPLINGHPVVASFTPDDHLSASITVALPLVLGTLVWLALVRRMSDAPKGFYVFQGANGEATLLICCFVGVLYSLISSSGWLNIDAGIFSIIRGISIGLTTLSIFVLAYRWGTREMPRKRILVFSFLCVCYVVVNSATLLLVNALSAILLALVAFSLGRRRVPWLLTALLLLIIVPLHYGKGEMRNKYWHDNGQVTFQPWDYPALYAEWAEYSLNNIVNADGASATDVQSFSERAGLIQLLLRARESTAQGVPHLYGATYIIIPQLLIPRFLTPDKPASHEGTYLLNIHYDIQTREDTASTTIGWGLMNEAYANFGLYGCIMLAILCGAGYGLVARWCLYAPVLSARYLFAVLLIYNAFQSEFSASVFVTALFQSSAPLVALTFLLMKYRQIREFNPQVQSQLTVGIDGKDFGRMKARA